MDYTHMTEMFTEVGKTFVTFTTKDGIQIIRLLQGHDKNVNLYDSKIDFFFTDKGDFIEVKATC